MVDFLTRRTARNEILQRVGRPIVGAGDAFSASRTTPGLGGLFVSETDRIKADYADEGFYIRLNPETGRPEKWDPRTGQYFVPDRLSVEELTRRYGDLGLKFDRPMTEKAAEILAEVKRAEIVRKDVLSRTASTGATIASFAGGFVAMATDPLELGASLIPFVGPGTKAAMVARFGAIRGRALAGATEGALGAALTEPFYAGLSLQMQLDYKAVDALINVGFGAVLGGGFGTVGGAFARARGEVPAGRADVEMARLEAPEVSARTGGDIPPGLFEVTRSTPTQEAAARVLAMEGPDVRIEKFRAALAEMAQGRIADLAPVQRQRFPLLRQIIKMGGIDPDSPLAGELRAMGVTSRTVPGIFNRKTGRKALDDIVAEENFDIAHRFEVDESGRFSERSVLEAIREEIGGNPVRPDDPRVAAAAEADASLERFDATVADLRAAGITGFGPEDVARVQEIMVRDRIDAEDAFERMAIAEEAAAHDPRRDFSGDPEASRAADEIEDFDALSADNEDLMEMIADMRDNGRLSRGAEDALAEAETLSKQAKAMGEAARVGAACLAR